jgi:protein TonB
MRRVTDQQPARRVVEEPKRSVLPYFAPAVVAAVAIWSFQQQSIQDSPPLNSPRPQASQTGRNPAKGELRTIFTADDYPVEAQIRGEEGTVQAELTIDQRGRVIGCSVLRSSGYPSLDNATCSILRRRARFTPARDASGDAVPAKLTTPPVTWRLKS